MSLIERQEPRAAAMSAADRSYRDVTLLADRRALRRGPRIARLTHREYTILGTFLERPTALLTADDLLAAIGRERGNAALIHTHISLLREKLNRDGERVYLHTVLGAGYLFDTGKERR